MKTLLLLIAPLMGLSCLNHDWNQAPFDDTRTYGTLAVFPGAEGFGTDTVAGRGGEVVAVTNLEADGPGSLRAALQTPGPRTVVFEVGGTIDLVESLVLSEPYVTVACQTAPPPGITLVGAGLVVATHDVLIQHIRVRVGDNPEGPAPDARDGISVLGESYNVVVDHCSVSWALDEGTSTWGPAVRDVTFSNCIIAENLSRSLHPEGEHSKGLLIGDHSRRIAVIKNIFAHNTERNPLIKGDVSALVVNNLIYNPRRDVIHFSDPEGSGPSRATIIGNMFIRGADTRRLTRMIHCLFTTKYGTVVYKEDNYTRFPGGRLEAAPSKTRGPRPVDVAPLAVHPADTIEQHLLIKAGACPSNRDTVDARIIQSVREGSGRIIDSPSEVGDIIRPTPVSRPLELPQNAGGDDDGDGYTNLEEWIHQFDR